MNKPKRRKRINLLSVLAKALKKAMASEDANISAMSKAIGVSRNQLYQIAKEQNQPKLDTAEKIAEYLGLTITIK